MLLVVQFVVAVAFGFIDTLDTISSSFSFSFSIPLLLIVTHPARRTLGV